MNKLALFLGFVLIVLPVSLAYGEVEAFPLVMPKNRNVYERDVLQGLCAIPISALISVLVTMLVVIPTNLVAVLVAIPTTLCIVCGCLCISLCVTFCPCAVIIIFPLSVILVIIISPLSAILGFVWNAISYLTCPVSFISLLYLFAILRPSDLRGISRVDNFLRLVADATWKGSNSSGYNIF